MLRLMKGLKVAKLGLEARTKGSTDAIWELILVLLSFFLPCRLLANAVHCRK